VHNAPTTTRKAAMNHRILDRYVLAEAGGSWLAVTVVLLAIMLSTRFARFLADAAAGALPRELLFKVVALSSLQYLVVLIPISSLLAIMLALGRLYKDHEVAAMMGCGVGLSGLYRPLLGFGVALTLFTAALAFEIGPWAGRTADYLTKNAARFIQYNPFEPGRFKEVAGGRAVFYTADMSADGRELGGIFAQLHEPDGTSVLIARRGSQRIDPLTGEREVRLEDGWRYLGEAGQAGYDTMRFAAFATRVAPPEFMYIAGKRKLARTTELVDSASREDRAELAWRLAAPVSVMILVLLAVPLSHIRPRQGRYGKLVMGICAYLAYSQLMGMGQAWIAQGAMPAGLGLWWAHALMLSVALALVARRQNWWARLRA
jgi:lipopolysaccharide export system permease protein